MADWPLVGFDLVCHHILSVELGHDAFKSRSGMLKAFVQKIRPVLVRSPS